MIIDKINKICEKFTDTSDILNFIGNNITASNKILIASYSDIIDKPSFIINNLASTDIFILLYDTGYNIGHWVTFFKIQGYNPLSPLQQKQGQTWEFFDSYGYFPDDELNANFGVTEKLLGSGNNILLQIIDELIKNNVPIEYNNYILQQNKEGINTCGRHVGNRLKYSFLNIDQYKKMLDYLLSCDFTKKIGIENYDQLVSAMNP